MPSTYYVAWWNLENLFDEENSPAPDREAAAGDRRRPRRLDAGAARPQDRPARVGDRADERRRRARPARRLRGREPLRARPARRRARARRCPGATTTSSTPTPTTPAGSTSRSSTTPTCFDVPADEVFFHVVMRRNATREIVQVNFKTQQDRTWAVFGNHWPSRSGGQFESAGYRHIAGETLGYFHQRVLEVHGADTPALAMGDFNDEPFDTSLVTHALSTRQRQRVVEADTPRFWNLTWPVIGDPRRRHLLLQQRAQPARPVPGQQEHGHAELADPRRARHGRDPALPRHVHHGQVPAAEAVRRHGQARRRERLLRPLPDRHAGHRGRLARTHQAGRAG